MIVYIFCAITVAVTVTSYFVYPTMESWVPVSIAAYTVMAVVFVTITAIKIRKLKKNNEPIIYKLFGIWDKIDMACIAVTIVFTWYMIISMVAYFRLLDRVIRDKLSAWSMVIIGVIVFTVFLLLAIKAIKKKKT